MKNIFGIPLVLFVGILLVGGVGAILLEYFGVFTTTIDVESPIVVSDGTTDVSGMAGSVVEGEEVTISNNADFDVDVQITSTEEEGVETSYIGTLELTQKIVVFGADDWATNPHGETAIVEYTIGGNTFNAEVTSETLDGYVLIYYKDNNDRYTNPATAILIEDVTGNLPYETDGNANEYNYCITGEYITCHGAKVWYVPESAILEGSELNWSRANEFLFETKLIQYNADGIVTMYPTNDLIFKPVFDLDIMLNGTIDVVITTTVDIAE